MKTIHASYVIANDDVWHMISQALHPYGAKLTDDRHIEKNGKVTPVTVAVKGGRIRFLAPSGSALFTGPVRPAAVEKFVEQFWFWEK